MDQNYAGRSYLLTHQDLNMQCEDSDCVALDAREMPISFFTACPPRFGGEEHPGCRGNGYQGV